MSHKSESKGIGTGTGLVIGIAVIYILLGLAMLLIPNFHTTYIIYAAGVILLVYGIILIVKYFLSGSYNDLGKYGFSGGVLSVLIGICMLIRASEVAAYFPLFLGICILLTAIIKLQTAVDLKSLGSQSWLVFLIIALIFLAAALIIVLDPLQKNATETAYIYYILVADGIVNLFCTLYLAIAIKSTHKKRSAKKELQVSEGKSDKPEETESESASDSMESPESASLEEDILTVIEQSESEKNEEEESSI